MMSSSDSCKASNFSVQLLVLLMLTAIFSFPFASVGVSIGNYFLSLPNLAVMVLSFVLFFVGAFEKKRFYVFASTIFIFFIITFPRHNLSSFVPSLAVFSMMILPLAIGFGRFDVFRLKVLAYRSFLYGFYVIAVFVLIEFVVSNISEGMWGNIQGVLPVTNLVSTYAGVNRAQAFFSEPSYLAIYACFSFYVFDVLEMASGVSRAFEKVVSALIVLSAVSTTGFLMLLLYNVPKFFKGIKISFRGVLRTKKFSARILFKRIFALVAGVLVVWLSSDIVMKNVERIMMIQDVIAERSYLGSVGFRINSILMLYDYYQSTGVQGLLIGEGYSNYEHWISNNFSHLVGTSIAEGQVSNMLTGIVMSTGLVGSFVIFLFVYLVVADLWREAVWPTIIFFGLFFLSYGNVTSSFFWLSLFITRILLSGNAPVSRACANKSLQIHSLKLT